MKRSCFYMESGSQWSVVFYVQLTCLSYNERRDRPNVSVTIGTMVETLLLFICLLTKWGLHRPILESSFAVKCKTIHKLFRCIGRISHSRDNTGQNSETKRSPMKAQHREPSNGLSLCNRWLITVINQPRFNLRGKQNGYLEFCTTPWNSFWTNVAHRRPRLLTWVSRFVSHFPQSFPYV